MAAINAQARVSVAAMGRSYNVCKLRPNVVPMSGFTRSMLRIQRQPAR
jgi:hypothetical protein